MPTAIPFHNMAVARRVRYGSDLWRVAEEAGSRSILVNEAGKKKPLKWSTKEKVESEQVSSLNLDHINHLWTQWEDVKSNDRAVGRNDLLYGESFDTFSVSSLPPSLRSALSSSSTPYKVATPP